MAAKNIDASSFIVQAYCDPHTGKMYPLKDKDLFLTELRKSMQLQKAREKDKANKDEIADLWAQARKNVLFL